MKCVQLLGRSCMREQVVRCGLAVVVTRHDGSFIAFFLVMSTICDPR